MEFIEYCLRFGLRSLDRDIRKWSACKVWYHVKIFHLFRSFANKKVRQTRMACNEKEWQTESEIVGGVLFDPPVEILPDTKRSSDIYQRKEDWLEARRLEAQQLARQREKVWF